MILLLLKNNIQPEECNPVMKYLHFIWLPYIFGMPLDNTYNVHIYFLQNHLTGIHITICCYILIVIIYFQSLSTTFSAMSVAS